jgi:hypothetical protein
MSSHYANATFAKERFFNALMYRLQQITTANGYRATVKSVFDGRKIDYNDIPTCPAIAVVIPMMDPYSEDSASNTGKQLVKLYEYLEDSSTPTTTLLIAEGDLQYAISKYPQMPGADGIPTCQNCTQPKFMARGTKQTNPKYCLEVEFYAYIGSLNTDPSVSIA